MKITVNLVWLTVAILVALAVTGVVMQVRHRSSGWWDMPVAGCLLIGASLLMLAAFGLARLL